MRLGGGLLEVHADGADALRREPRRHAVREGERCSEAKHEQILCRKEDLATALCTFLHLNVSSSAVLSWACCSPTFWDSTSTAPPQNIHSLDASLL